MIGGHSATKIHAVGGNIAQLNDGNSIDVGATSNSMVKCELGCGRRLANSVISAIVIAACTVGGAFVGSFCGEMLVAHSENDGQNDL